MQDDTCYSRNNNDKKEQTQDKSESNKEIKVTKDSKTSKKPSYKTHRRKKSTKIKNIFDII